MRCSFSPKLIKWSVFGPSKIIVIFFITKSFLNLFYDLFTASFFFITTSQYFFQFFQELGSTRLYALLCCV